MNRVRPATRNNRSRSLLNDHKNQALKRPSLPKPHLKAKIVTKVASRQNKSLMVPTQNKSQPQRLSPVPETRKGSLVPAQPFCKSEEETKAENEERTWSPLKGQGWSGILDEYRSEIMEYVLQREREFQIETGYLHLSHILTPKFRVYLVRHIFKIYDRYDLKRTTLHLAVFYLDHYLNKNPFLKDQLETVATAQACLYIAMKYEEIYPPDFRDWVDRRHRQDVLKIQAKILDALNFQLTQHTVEQHLQMLRWEKGHCDQEEEEARGDLLADLSLFDPSIRQICGSKVAEAIFALVGGQEAPDYKVGLAVKWMIERNGESLYWLQQQKYGFTTRLL